MRGRSRLHSNTVTCSRGCSQRYHSKVTLSPTEEFEWIRKRRERANELVCSFALPLLAMQPGKRVTIIGSGFLLELGDDVLLISAAHVFYPPSRGGSKERGFVFERRDRGRPTPQFVPLRGRLAQSSIALSTDDPHDVAAMLLDRALHGVLQGAPKVLLSHIDPELRQTDVVPDVPGAEPFTMYGVVGFPASRLKRAGRGPRMTMAAMWGPPPPLNLGASDENAPIPLPTHLLINIDLDRTARDEPRPVAAPKPQGMSGGPVWRCTFSEGRRPEAKLVGIAIEYRQPLRCVVASRIGVVFNLVRHLFTGVANLLPQAPSYEPDIFTGEMNRY
jgi:hypothetical protein